jgi:hypothetical protein
MPKILRSVEREGKSLLQPSLAVLDRTRGLVSGQKPMKITIYLYFFILLCTISLQYRPSKSLISYREASLFVTCLIDYNPKPLLLR